MLSMFSVGSMHICFGRWSLHGSARQVDTGDTRAVIAYVWWLAFSTGVSKLDKAKQVIRGILTDKVRRVSRSLWRTYVRLAGSLHSCSSPNGTSWELCLWAQQVLVLAPLCTCPCPCVNEVASSVHINAFITRWFSFPWQRPKTS